MPWMTITCAACGHTADLDQFCRTEIYGELPRDEYQCPSCSTAIVRRFGPATIHPSGWVEPGKVEIVPIEARL